MKNIKRQLVKLSKCNGYAYVECKKQASDTSVRDMWTQP